MAAKGDELVKYLTVQVVKYIETPKEVRRQKRAGRREAREHWQYRWFGMLPLALSMWLRPLREQIARFRERARE
ncbi:MULTISPECIES: YqzE family protein [Paenibacillus]|uniref:YqzE family protein n=1 Tax=Paenibacillus TaxID=44249 RepID=UPI0022B93126|nr:YqzE family protein [Paenibacillus caseinilyticus]MCZ8517973.1 YqzE family protein [Paenibacillus caseinilyticus]